MTSGQIADNLSDDSASHSGNDDYAGHDGIGDDTMLNVVLAFSPESTVFATALRSDDLLPPPFLPPAGRPPQV